MNDEELVRSNRSIILVAGMHRSGTSAVTRFLNLYGASLPKNLLKPVKNDNDLGFWESQVLMEFHDEVLNSIGCTWDSVSPIPDDWFRSSDAQTYQNRLCELIESQFGDFKVGLVKDPRICKLVPLWEAALKEMGIDSHYIISLRNPSEIAQSLFRRNGIELNYALALWFVHLRMLEMHTRELPRVFVRFEDLLKDSQSLSLQLSKTLNVQLNWGDDDIKIEVEKFLDQSLRRQEVSQREFLENTNIPDVVKYFYSWLERSAEDRRTAATETEELGLEIELDKFATTDFVKFLRDSEAIAKKMGEARLDLDRAEMSVKEELALRVGAERKILKFSEEIRSKDVEFSLKEARFNEALDAQVKEVQTLTSENDSKGLVIEEQSWLIAEKDKRVTELSDELSQRLELERKVIEETKAAYELKMSEVWQEADQRVRDVSLDNVRLAKRAHDLKFALDGVFGSSAWKVGAFLYRVAKKIRLSFVGKGLLFLKAVLTFNLRNYIRMRNRLKIVRESGLFDAEYYLRLYPLIEHSLRSPLEHYVGHGEREGRMPNAFFNPSFYAQQLGSVENEWHSLLVHYIKEGSRKGLNPSADFSTEMYRKKFRLDEDENPLGHYLRYGDASDVGSLNDGFESEDSTSVRVSTPLQLEIECVFDEICELTLSEKLQSLNFKRDTLDPKISIIIPFFNKLEFTVDCLYALNAQEFNDYEVLLVDDASTDKEVNRLSEVPGIKLIRNPQNLGYLKSCNKAAKEAEGQFLLQLNNDTLPLDGWLKSLLETFEQHEDAGIAGSLMLDRDGKVQEAGGLIFNDASGYNYGRGQYPSKACFNYARETDYCSGASILIRADLWKKVRGYDERYAPAYYEDADIAMSAKQLGYRVIYNPFSRIVHHEGVSSGNSVSSGVKKHQGINKDKFYQKWQNQLDLRPSIPSHESVDQYVRSQVSKGWILWVDSNTPTPDKDAGSIETVHFFEQALADGWGVSFVPWDAFRDEGRYTKSLQSMGVECLYDGLAPARTAMESLQHLPHSYDIVVLSRATVALQSYPVVKACFPKAKVIFNTVDLHFLRYERELELLKRYPAYKMPARSQKISKDEELLLVQRCDATIVVSEVEAKIIESEVQDSNVAVIPLFGDVVGRINDYNKRLNVGFIGGFQHPPNVDAVKYFAKEVWPLVSQRLKGCKFIIAGSNVSEEVADLASDSIEIRGFVPTVQELLEEVKLMVAPLRYGAGIKGKIVSGLCHGVPQVVSLEASEGMGLIDKQDLLIANSAEEFSDKIVELYETEAAWNKMSDAGVAAAERLYSKKVLSVKISELLNKLKPNLDHDL